MERIIKFRGKRVDNGEWVFGSLVQDNHPEIKKSFIQHNDVNDLFIRFSVEVIPETVGQFTGLLDKNGKDIYEGDVVVNEFVKEFIHWDKFNGWVVSDEQTLGDVNFAMIEIIGNIHDNTELLK